MTLAVLNNRILQLTDRRFRPTDYGARNLRELLEALAPEIVVSGDRQHTTVELRTWVSQEDPDSSADVAISGPSRIAQEPVNPPPESSLDFEHEIDDKIAGARDGGDFFTVGELLARSLKQHCEKSTDALVARIVAAWATLKGPLPDPKSVADLVASLDLFSDESIATALVNAIYRIRKDGQEVPEGVGDLAFRLRGTIAQVYNVEERRSPLDTCNSAVAKLGETIFQLEFAVDRLLRTSAVTAKIPSIEVLKMSHVLCPFLMPAERGFLRDLEVLIGRAFRKFCEAYERNDDLQVLQRAPEFLENIKSHTPSSNDPRLSSSLWSAVVAPILQHISTLVEDAMSRGEAALAPTLGLRNRATKADLRLVGGKVFLSFALRNSGRGHAHDVSLQSLVDDPAIQLSLVEPAGSFDVAPDGEQLVRVRVALTTPASHIAAPIKWVCRTPLAKEATFADEIIVAQQLTEPNWESLIADPPYSLNPIRRPDRLYGRETALQALTLAAMSGASKFVWGQKRIGKTSLLQVLATKLGERQDTTCILLRMGELAPLHEGEIGRLIARRLAERSKSHLSVPTEAECGASIGRLVPFVEDLSLENPTQKFIAIVDEFDDIDQSFYMGERGKQFIKALRSISEVGLTLFFAGSERMEAIYQRHQADLNKWTNVRLDRIDSRTECKALITNPLADAIEFSKEAVDFIIDYCGMNPFYINNFCYQTFERCLQEHRTFVDDNDTDTVRHQLLRALGQTNFSHFWQDNPLLGQEERDQAAAENCIALTCIAVLGGRYEEPEELVEVQESLPLSVVNRATEAELRRSCERLLTRNVLGITPEKTGFHVNLQIFRDWLVENAVSALLPIWTTYRENQRITVSQPAQSATVNGALDSAGFVIPEDDILAVSQRLIFCGRQKDVAEIRSWLRQFDDEPRIEVAFLLLKRLTEKGFINEGTKSLAVGHLEEMIRARRLEIGRKTWKVERGRLDNLCLTYVDSELKSGAAATRELRARMRPGKSGPAFEIGTWMRSHIDDDPMIIVVDDFAGTGGTLAQGIERLRDQVDPIGWKTYITEGRISVFVMFAFPEALEHVRTRCAGVHVVAANVLGDDLRACAKESGIFENDADRRFARDVLLQLGRELYPAAPLGFGDLGGLLAFHNAIPNNTLPIFWSNGRVGERQWKPIFPRA
jgi:hypothetical protein